MNLRYFLLILSLMYAFNGVSQISSTSSDYREATGYSGSDTIFVFCTEDINGGYLMAEDSTGIGGYDFKWYGFNTVDSAFTDVLAGTINTDSTASELFTLPTGGYKVVLNKGAMKQEYVAWVFNNVGRSVEIKFGPDNSCDFLWMEVEPYLQRNELFDTDLSYYDTTAKVHTIFQNRLDRYQWSSSPTEDDFSNVNAPFASIVESPFDNESELPTDNTVFSVNVTDKFGCTVADDIDYTAIETDARFSWVTIPNGIDELPQSGSGDESLSGSAPLHVKFTNESKNGLNYIWFFGDTLWNNDIDSVRTTDELLEPEHIYYYVFTGDSSKTYTMKLYSESEHGCTDSIYFNINMLPFKLELPNVFTPNADEQNDVFKLQEGFQSIRNFKITIFNRVGQVVHEFEGDVYNWEGWDGKVRNSNREAPEGTYFFVVEVAGWDNVNYDNKNLGKSGAQEEGGENTSAGGDYFGTVILYR